MSLIVVDTDVASAISDAPGATTAGRLSDAKNPYGCCNHGPNGLTCPVCVARVSSTH